MNRILIVLALASALLLAALVAPRPAAAQGKEQVAQAKKFFEAGRQAYEAGQYAVAIAAFEEAYRVTPRPPVLFSLAQSYRRQYFVDRDPAKLKRAVDLYREYLVAQPTGGRRDDAIQYISELEPILARVEEEQRKAGKGPVQAMSPSRSEGTKLLISSRTKGVTAMASIDGEKLSEAPLLKVVTPGPHKVRVEAEGYFPEEVETVAFEGQLIPVEVNLREMPAKVTVKSIGGAEISMDGRPVAASSGKPFEYPAGKHFLTVAKRGHHAYTREIVLKRGQAMVVDAPLDTTTQRVVSWYVLGAAGAVLVGAGVTTTMAFLVEADAQALLDQQQSGGITDAERAEYMALREDRDDYATMSYFLYGGAAALAITGTLLYLIDSPRVEAGPAGTGSTVTPTITAGGIGLSWTGSF